MCRRSSGDAESDRRPGEFAITCFRSWPSPTGASLLAPTRDGDLLGTRCSYFAMLLPAGFRRSREFSVTSTLKVTGLLLELAAWGEAGAVVAP